MITHPEWDRRLPLAIGTFVGLGVLAMVGTAVWFIVGVRHHSGVQGFELLHEIKPMLRPMMAGISTGMSLFLVGMILHWANSVRIRG